MVTSEQYNGLNFLRANAGDWVNASFGIRPRFYFLSDLMKSATIIVGGVQLNSGTWYELGFNVGDSIDIDFTVSGVPVTTTKTIDYINGGQLLWSGGTSTDSYAGQQLPDYGGTNSGITVFADKAPESIEFTFNLTPTGTVSNQSIIDNEVNRFASVGDVSTMIVGDTLTMEQLGNKSGGFIIEAVLERVADTGADRNYEITFKFVQWGLIQDGSEPPIWYTALNCLNPFFEARVFGDYTNPNSVLIWDNGAVAGNTGYRDENWNQGVNNYSIISTTTKDITGNIIPSIQFSEPTDVEVIINANGQDTTLSKYRFGMYFAPIDASIYQNKPDTLLNNLTAVAPDFDFAHSLVISPTIYDGYDNSASAGFDITNTRFTIIGSTVRFNCRIVPNANADAYFTSVTPGSRRIVLFVGISNVDQTDKVNLTVFDGQMSKAPIIPVTLRFAVNDIFDHSQNITTAPTVREITSYAANTEDDLAFAGNIILMKGEIWSEFRCGIIATNTGTGEEFTLEQLTFPFTGAPISGDGKQLLNAFQDVYNDLPSTSAKKTAFVKTVATGETVTDYQISVYYPFLLRWEYWLPLAGVSVDFDPNYNKNWLPYDNTGNWEVIIRLALLNQNETRVKNYNLNILDYDQWDHTSIIELFRYSDMAPITAVIPDIILVKATHTISLEEWDESSVWGQITAEKFESSPRPIGSTILDYDNSPTNPIVPIVPLTKTKITFPSPGVVVLEELFDLSKISASNQISFTSKIKGNEISEEGLIFTDDQPVLDTDNQQMLPS